MVPHLPRARMPAAMQRLIRRVFPAALFASLGLAVLTGCSSAPTAVPSGGVLFQDDFSRSSSGWEVRRQSDAVFEYRQGEYAMQVLAAHTSVWSTPGLSVGEVRVEVDARMTGGSADNLYGVICRYQGDDDFAFLIASGDGFAGIGEVKDGRRRLLSGEAMLPADSIAPGGLSNHLTAECLSDVLRLSINGTLVAEVESSTRASEADVGLIVGSYEEPEIELAFDNFSARAP
jgi:hypothetical protein